MSADERIVSQSGAEVRPADSVGNDFERTAAVTDPVATKAERLAIGAALLILIHAP